MGYEQRTATEGMIFRKTNSEKGRKISVTPDNSPMRHLAYGRIILDKSRPSANFATGARESGLICISGEATVTVDGKPFALGKFDAMYVPRDSTVEVITNSTADLSEFSAEVAKKYP